LETRFRSSKVSFLVVKIVKYKRGITQCYTPIKFNNPSNC